MLAYGVQPAKRLEPFARWPTLALILAACGGGGSGSSGCPVKHFIREGADAALAALTAEAATQGTNVKPAPTVTFTLGTNGEYSASIPENTPRFISQETETAIEGVSDLTVESVTFSSAQKATLTVSATTAAGRQTLSLEYIVSGEDAELIELVAFSSDGRSITFQAAVLPDYERPADANGDNVYKATITARYGSVEWNYVYNLRINDEADGSTTVPSPAARSSVPAHTREGDEIRITVEEGNTEIFVVNVGNLSLSGQNLLAGPDADKFQITTTGFGSSRKAIIEFKDAPSTDVPTDVGVDNIYNFELDGAAEDIYGDISFEITVIDNPNEIL